MDREVKEVGGTTREAKSEERRGGKGRRGDSEGRGGERQNS